MIKVHDVSKTYGGAAALVGVSFEVGRGECLGLTGANGAGRTTLLRVIATLVRPSSGVVLFDGADAFHHVDRVRSRLAYVGESRIPSSTMRSMTVGQYLELVLRARRSKGQNASAPDVHDVLDRAGLDGGAALGSLSAGMRTRLSLAAALSCGADVLLLDDPFQAVDSCTRGRFVEWLQQSRESGTTIVAALNDDRDAAALCHRVAVLDRGRMLALSQEARTEPASIFAAATNPA